jgi:O-methyltransferase involved in polyketide biosynthesis
VSGQILHGNDPSRSAPADRERARGASTGVTGLASGEPSQTALTAAAARAAHLIVDGEPRIFADTLASALLGPRAEEFIGFHRSHGGHPVLAAARAQATTRSRYAEDRLASSGLSQYVILGAGLDSYAYRCPASGVRVFEVDHPDTQRWKRRALAAAGIAVPGTVSFVPADLERGTPPAGLTPSGADLRPGKSGPPDSGPSPDGPLASSLHRAGFDLATPAFVSCLGVLMYLSAEAIERTLTDVGALAPGTEIVADYMLPAGLRDEAGEAYVAQVSPIAAERGEPWLSFFTPAEMTALLTGHGFGQVAHVRQRDTLASAGWNRSDPLRPGGLSRLAHATAGARVMP